MQGLCRLSIVLPLILVTSVIGCSDETINRIVSPDELSPPLGLQTITGDEEVTLLWWCSNYGNELVGYKVFMVEGAQPGDPREELPAGFTVRDSISVTPPCSEHMQLSITGLSNGVTYSFLVVAAKGEDWEEISHTSNIVHDTPRPESAEEATLFAHQQDPTEAGYELSSFTIVDVSSLNSAYETSSGLGDIMCERFDPGAGTRAWIDGINGATVQDVGYMQDWYDLDLAPSSGYASAGHSVEALPGHVYAVRTADDNYAKFQILEIDAAFAWIRIKAAYQFQAGNRQLGW